MLWPTQICFGLVAYFNIQLYEQTSKDYACRGPTPHTLSHRVLTRASGSDERNPLVLLGELVPEGVADSAAGSCLL